MAERDRSARYNHASSKRGQEKQAPGDAAAEKKAAATADGKDAPHEPSVGKVGKEGIDPGPEKGKDATWGVTAGRENPATRHKREHSDMLKRHSEEAASMHERHAGEAKTMHSRHSSELQDTMDQMAENKLTQTAGSPKELGSAKSEGKKGAEV
jgi:hypothetical protein